MREGAAAVAAPRRGGLVDAARVQRVASALPDRDRMGDLAEMFALLGDRNRLLLLVSLLEAGELCVGDLAATTEMSESAASHALRLLRAQGIVRFRRDGRLSYYSLRDDHVRMILDLALSHIEHTHG